MENKLILLLPIFAGACQEGSEDCGKEKRAKTIFDNLLLKHEPNGVSHLFDAIINVCFSLFFRHQCHFYLAIKFIFS